MLPNGFSSENSEDQHMLQFGLIDGTGVNWQPQLKCVVVHGHYWIAELPKSNVSQVLAVGATLMHTDGLTDELRS
jgi:hypothetical protein